MIEAEIRKLDQQASRRSLDGLEQDIWQGVAQRRQVDRVSALVLGCQAVVLAAALIGSATFGNRAALELSKEAELDVFSAKTAFAPSTILLGRST